MLTAMLEPTRGNIYFNGWYEILGFHNFTIDTPIMDYILKYC